MSRPLLSSNVVCTDHEELDRMNNWKLETLPRATGRGWGYREDRFLPKPRGVIHRALAATTHAALTVAGHVLSR